MHQRSYSLWVNLLDVAVILAVSLVAESAHFTWKQGRSLISADSLQYLDNAEAILSAERPADFSMRKPGFSVMLALAGLLFGNMFWGAVVLNHLCQALLPLGAYGLGRQLHSRGVGWLAALLTIARLFDFYWAERLMSESLYTVLLTYGLLLLIAGLKSDRSGRWVLPAGVVLAAAWSVRSVATTVLGASVLTVLLINWRRPLRAVFLSVVFLAPSGVAFVSECGLNYANHGRFRAATGTAGMMPLMRARHLLNVPMPDNAAARDLAKLLPERSFEDVFRGNKLDSWVSRYRYLQQPGTSEFEYDALCRRAADGILRDHLWESVRLSGEVFLRHLLRQDEYPSLSRVAADEQMPILAPPGVAADDAFQEHWYDYWALPQYELEQSIAYGQAAREAANQRAPFGAGGLWDALRYWSLMPLVADITDMLAQFGSIWPGFALLLAGVIGLNRAGCWLLGLCLLADAALIGFLGATETANARFQVVWIAIDTTLAAALFAPLLHTIKLRLDRWSPPRSRRLADPA